VDRRRAGDAGPAAQPPVEGRVDRIRRQRAEGEGGPKKKNPLPLVLAGIGVLAFVVGGSMLLFGGKKDAKSSSGQGGPGAGQETGTAGAPGAPRNGAGVPPAEKTFEQLDTAQRLAFLDGKRKEAAASAEATKSVVEWMRSKNLSEDAQHCIEEGHKAFPVDVWICRELGLTDRSDDLKKILDDEVVMDAVPEDDPNLIFVRGLYDRSKREKNPAWLKKEDSDRLDKALAALKDVGAKMSDPVYQNTVREFRNQKGNAAFTGMDFAFNGNYRPFVIFAEAPGPDRMKDAEVTVDRTGKALSFVYNRWLQFMKEDLKLDAPRVEDLKDYRFKVFVFKSRESFDNWHLRNKFGPQSPSIAAYYQPYGDHMILMYLGAFDPSVMMHEATHQIIHFYARYFTQRDDDAESKKKGEPLEKVQFEDHRLASSFFWFQEGIAEYFGGAGLGATESEWKIGNLQKGRMAFFSYMKSLKKTWPLEDFLFSDQGKIDAFAKTKTGGAGGEELKVLMYSQGWTLVHYFLNGEGGKWRDQFHALMRNELSGRSGMPYLLQAFGLVDSKGVQLRSTDPKVAAFIKEVEAGYLKYFDDLWKKGQ
jgi:hypothetical protein